MFFAFSTNNLFNETDALHLVFNILGFLGFLTLFGASFVLERTPKNVNRFVTMLHWLFIILAIEAITFILPIIPEEFRDGQMDNIENGVIPIGKYMFVVHTPLLNIFSPWKYVLPSSFVILATYLTLFAIQYHGKYEVREIQIAVIYYAFCLVSKYFMELFQKYSYVSFKKSGLLVHLLEFSQNISIILDNNQRVYWGNKQARNILGVCEGCKYSNRIAVNRALRDRIIDFSLTNKESPVFNNPVVFMDKNSKKTSGILTTSHITQENGFSFVFLSFHLHDESEKRMEMYLDSNLQIEFVSASMAEFFQRNTLEIEGSPISSFLYSCGSKDSDKVTEKLTEEDRDVTALTVGSKSCHFQHRWIKDTEGNRMYAYVECTILSRESEETRLYLEANKRNKEFMEHTFHEVRNPLAVITGLVDEMEEVLGGEEEAVVAEKRPFFDESMETMQLCLHSVMRTLSRTLSVEKMRAGETVLNMFSFNLNSVLRELSTIYQINAKTNGSSFCWKIDEPLVRKPIFSDMEKLTEIVRNYLGNAMKYTKTGFVNLRFKLLDAQFSNMITDEEQINMGGYIQAKNTSAREDGMKQKLEQLDGSLSGSDFSHEAERTRFEFEEGEQYHLRIEVEDSGMGLEEDELKRLFVRYAQIRAGEMQKGKGTGLGLNLCKANAEMLGGSVGVTSVRGEGSVFFTTIPLFFSEKDVPEDILARCEEKEKEDEKEDEDENKEDEKEEDEETVNARKKAEAIKKWHRNRTFRQVPFSEGRVIMCEDMASLRKITAKRLRKFGLEVIEMEDGVELLEYFKEHGMNHNVDVVLTDEEMPLLNGSLALVEMREMGIDVPVVMVTGNAMKHQQEIFYERKADNVLTKPCSTDELYNEMTKYFT